MALESASLPVYEVDGASPEWMAPPEYTGLDLTRHNTQDRISFRKGSEDALATTNRNKVTDRLDHIIAGHHNPHNIATLKRWKSEIIECLKGPETDPDFNYYITSNALKVIEKLDGLIRLTPGEMLIPLEGKMQKEYRAKNLVKSLKLESPQSYRSRRIHPYSIYIAQHQQDSKTQGLAKNAISAIIADLSTGAGGWNLKHRGNWMKIYDRLTFLSETKAQLCDSHKHLLDKYTPKTFIANLDLVPPPQSSFGLAISSILPRREQHSLVHNRISRRVAAMHDIETFGEAKEGGLRLSPL